MGLAEPIEWLLEIPYLLPGTLVLAAVLGTVSYVRNPREPADAVLLGLGFTLAVVVTVMLLLLGAFVLLSLASQGD